MRIAVYICMLFTLVAVEACNSETTGASSEYVIEGWIENEAYPIVKLTRSIPIKEEYQSLDSLEQYVARWERITICDGEKTVTLTGKMDSRYMPPYIYTTTDIMGQAGRPYQLTLHLAEEGAQDIVATTTIPEAAVIDSFHITPVGSDNTDDPDTPYQLYAHVSIPKTPVTYYKIFTQTNAESQDFLPAYFGLIRSDMIPDNGEIVVNRGVTNLEKHFSPYFHIGDTAVVRFARIDSAAYEYWRIYEDIVMLASNPLFPTTTSLPRSISGAYGFWQGMGSNYYMVPIVSRKKEPLKWSSQNIKQ